MRKSPLTMALAAVASLALAGCPSEESTDPPAATGGMPATGGMDATDSCGLPAFALDVEAEGATLKVKLLGAEPAPPVKYYNDWTVEVTDLDGNPITDPADFEVEPYMVAHGHGVLNGYEPEITALDEPGQFLISPVYMWMSGKWDVFFKSPGELRSEAATLNACIPN